MQSPEPEPHEQFAQAWMKAAEPASGAPRQELSLNQPRQWSDLPEPERPPWWTQDQPSLPWLSAPPAETGDEGTSGSALQQPPRARAVGPAEALISRPNLKLVDKRMQLAVQTNRIPADIAEEAMHDLMKGNFTQCIGGTGNAHNGYAAHFRDGELVSVSRIK